MKLDELLTEYRESLEAESLPELPSLAPHRAAATGPRLTAWWWPAVAVAAALLVASVWWRPVAPPTAQPVAIVRSTAPLTSVPAVAAAVTEKKATPVRRAPRRLVPAAAPAQPRLVRRYVELAEASMLPAPSVMQVVRVSVRPERLRALGIAYPASERDVDAELLVGDDGIARALRVIGE